MLKKLTTLKRVITRLGSYAEFLSGLGDEVLRSAFASIWRIRSRGYVELFTNLFKSVVSVHVDTEEHAQYRFTRCWTSKNVFSCAA